MSLQLDLNGGQESGRASQDFNFDEQLISWTEDNNCLLQPGKPTQPSLSWEGVKDILAPENGWLDLPPEIPSLASTLCDYSFKEVIRKYCAWDSKVKEDQLLATYLLGHTASWHDPGNLALDQFQASRVLVHEWTTQGANSETC